VREPAHGRYPDAVADVADHDGNDEKYEAARVAVEPQVGCGQYHGDQRNELVDTAALAKDRDRVTRENDVGPFLQRGHANWA